MTTTIALTLDDISTIQVHLNTQRRSLYREMLDAKEEGDLETVAQCQIALDRLEALIGRVAEARYEQCRAPAANIDLFTR